MHMGIFSGLFRSRDKPKDSYDSPSYSYFFGRTHAGKRVNDRTAMQIIAVYACVRVLSEAIAQLPLHVYQYTDSGKERVPRHPLYFLLHDQPNPEMTSFVFRETLMAHLLIYGNAYAQIIRNGRGDVIGLYPLMHFAAMLTDGGDRAFALCCLGAATAFAAVMRKELLERYRD